MLKRRLLGTSIASLAFVAIVGSGFSAWMFDSDVRADLSINDITIQHAISFGTMANDGKTYSLVLDQGTKSTEVTTDGVSLKEGTENATDVSATWTLNTTSYNDVKAKIVYKFNVYIKKTTLGRYVTADKAGLSGNTTIQGITNHEHSTDDYYVFTADATTGAPATSGDNTSVTLSYNVSNMFRYYAAAEATGDGSKILKPTTMVAYKQMVNLITGEAEDNVTADKEYNGNTGDLILEFQVVTIM